MKLGMITKKNKHEHTEWHNVVCFNKTADFVTQFLDKGHLVYVEGSLRTRVWVNNQKEEKKIIEIFATQITPLNTKK